MLAERAVVQADSEIELKRFVVGHCCDRQFHQIYELEFFSSVILRQNTMLQIKRARDIRLLTGIEYDFGIFEKTRLDCIEENPQECIMSINPFVRIYIQRFHCPTSVKLIPWHCNPELKTQTRTATRSYAYQKFISIIRSVLCRLKQFRIRIANPEISIVFKRTMIQADAEIWSCNGGILEGHFHFSVIFFTNSLNALSVMWPEWLSHSKWKSFPSRPPTSIGNSSSMKNLSALMNLASESR